MPRRRNQLICALTLLVSACAHEAPQQEGQSVCRTPMPLELRLRRMEGRIALAYANAPPLSRDEAEHMQRLAACYGSGHDCTAEWDAAQASGLADRYRLRSAEYAIPEWLGTAIAAPLGARRTGDLLVALAVSNEAEDALKARSLATTGAHDETSMHMMLVGADIEQAIICDAADLANGRTRGTVYDPSALIPAGP